MCKPGEICTCVVPCERCLSIVIANSKGKIIYSKEYIKNIKENKK